MKRLEITAALVFVPAFLLAAGWFTMSLLRDQETTLPDTPVAEVKEAGSEPVEDPGLARLSSAPRRPAEPRADRTSEVIETPDQTAVEPDPLSGDPGSIEGRVLGAHGSPLADVQVELARGPSLVMNMPSLRQPTGLLMKTDGFGTFSFPRVPPGDDYLLVARHPEYEDTVVGPIHVRAGKAENLGDLRLKAGVSVSGFVGSSGRPLPGARVVLQNTLAGFFPEEERNEEALQLSVTTKGDGTYRFDNIPIANFEVVAEANGYARQIKNNRQFLSAPQDQTIDFDLGPAQIITGVVVDGSGRPLAGATVQGSLAGESHRCESTAVTDEGGAFRLEQLAEGHYHLTAKCDGFSPATKPRIASGTTNLEVQLLPQGRVLGVVLDEANRNPVTDFELIVLRAIKGRTPARSGQKQRFHDPGGAFEVAGLDPNSYVLEARAPGYAASSSTEFLVSRGEATTGVEILMNRGGSLAGRVVDSRGSPVSGAMVSVNTNNFKWNPVQDLLNRMAKIDTIERRQRTGADGRFELDLIVPDVYQVSVRHPEFASAALNDVEVLKDQVTPVGDLVLMLGGTVEGYAYDSTGAVLGGATISAVSKESDFAQGRCDGDGYFRLTGLPPGDYTVSIQNYTGPSEENVLVKMLRAKNSAQEIAVADGERVTLELRLQEEIRGGH